jgi:LmbE family N-acetylglucosaminyl deacetylase
MQSLRSMFRPVVAATVATVVFAGFGITAAEPSPVAIREELRSFGTYATVLHIAAHPDDENTQLIAYLAGGRGYRMGYLSVTRGDGGQNEIGPEFSERLGLARTQELLAARRIDGGRQFFTRALDFGYSKSVDETLAIWDRKQVVADVVRVIREFRPDVIVTRFSPEPSGTHGHHTASAVVALEAFKLAGDPKAFPEQLAEGLTPWQPVRILHNGWRGEDGGAITLKAGGKDAVMGESFQAIAMRSRAQHKTQGFGMRPAGDGEWTETFRLLGGSPATNDIMDGIDTTWARVPGGAEVARLTEEALAKFDGKDPAASVPALLELRKRVAALPTDPVVADKRRQLDHVLQGCLGLTVESVPAVAEVAPGETLAIRAQTKVRSSVPVRWVAVSVPGLADVKRPASLQPGEAVARDLSFIVPKATPLTQPYWLREEPTTGMFRVAETKLIGRPENPPAFTVDYEFEVGGQTLVVADDLMAPADGGKPARPVAVISPVSMRFESGVALFAPGGAKLIQVDVTAARADAVGILHLEAPGGWTVSPVSQAFKIARAGESTKATFTVKAPASAASGALLAVAEIDGARFSNSRVVIDYPHIPLQLLQPQARLKVVAFDVATRGKAVGYLPGAGDDTAESLEQLGYKVTMLTGADLTPEKLAGLDAVVIGVRAFNERKDLAANLPGLFAYVEAGGTVVAQYNRPNGLRAQPLGPYEISIAGPAPKQRVTDETAPVSFLAPDHPALTTPNKIGPADFNGWVQERGAYFPSSWDAHYTPVLAMNDPGEEPLKSSVLIARHGKGYFVYTGLAFFRQLPAGVPGAYRLFANLVSLGK